MHCSPRVPEGPGICQLPLANQCLSCCLKPPSLLRGPDRLVVGPCFPGRGQLSPDPGRSDILCSRRGREGCGEGAGRMILITLMENPLWASPGDPSLRDNGSSSCSRMPQGHQGPKPHPDLKSCVPLWPPGNQSKMEWAPFSQPEKKEVRMAWFSSWHWRLCQLDPNLHSALPGGSTKPPPLQHPMTKASLGAPWPSSQLLCWALRARPTATLTLLYLAPALCSSQLSHSDLWLLSDPPVLPPQQA